MYNLLMGRIGSSCDSGRIGENTTEVLKNYIRPDGRTLDPSRVMNLPTLLMPETGDTEAEQVARVGRIESMTPTPRGYNYRFVPNPDVAPIASSAIEAAATELEIGNYEFTRTHWAVKDVDLYDTIQRVVMGSQHGQRVFPLPTHEPREQDLVAVMMPFSRDFDSTYVALTNAASAAGMRCQRADEIWENHHIIADVISLLWRARVIIADLSGRNANVFYETGIAHTLGRDVIQVTRNMDDVPFDLQGIRTVAYYPNNEGLTDLADKVATRLRRLTSKP